MDRVYQPLQTLKAVGENIWITDGPIVQFYRIPFPTRMTIIKRASGGLLVHSPIQSTPALLAGINALGAVEAIIAPNWIHYVSVIEWAEAYPDAMRYYAPGVVERAKKHGMQLPDGITFDDQNPWAPEVEALLVQGSRVHHEVILFHAPSQTLVLTDLIENFEREKVSGWLVPIMKLGGILAPAGSMPRDMRLTFRQGKTALRQAVQQMIDWEPERVIISHGKWFERDGFDALKHAFRWLLKS